MILVLIIVAWLSLIAICWVLCAMAGRGDAELESESSLARGNAELTSPENPSEPAAQDAEPTAQDARYTSSGIR